MNPEIRGLGCGVFSPSVSRPNKSTCKSLLFLKKILDKGDQEVIFFSVSS